MDQIPTSSVALVTSVLLVMSGAAWAQPAPASPSSPEIALSQELPSSESSAETPSQLAERLRGLDEVVRQRLRAFERQGVGREAEFEREAKRLARYLRGLELETRRLGDEALLGKARAAGRVIERLARTARNSAAGKAAARQRSAGETVRQPFKGGVPANDDCADAMVISNGSFSGTTLGATDDGDTSCGVSINSPDVWFRYSSPEGGVFFAETQGATFDTVLSVHSGCPGTVANEITCNDDNVAGESMVGFELGAGEEVLLRLGGFGDQSGAWTLNIGPGGAIAGRVIETVSGQPIAGLSVEILDATGFPVASRDTDTDGRYSIEGLGTGNYFAAIGPQSSVYLPEIYDNVACLNGFCDTALGTPIAVIAGEMVEDIDFSLDRGGAIAGTVREAGTGEPVNSFFVEVVNADGQGVDSGFSTGPGTYRFEGLPAGNYFVSTSSTGLLDELYDDIPCPFFDCIATEGTPIPVSLNTTTEGIDFELERLSSITGRVTEAATGEPIAFLSVSAVNGDFNQGASDLTDADGRYELNGLVADTYFVSTEAFSEFQNEIFDDIPCLTDTCNPTDGTPIVVGDSLTVGEIDFALDPLGLISGRVTAAATGEPFLPLARVIVDRPELIFAGDAQVDGTGHYTVENLEPGTYHVLAGSPAHQTKLYDDVPCPQANCDRSAGDLVAVELAAATPGIDFSLVELGSISGRVTEVVTGEPISNVVQVYDGFGFFVNSVSTSSDGTYTLPGLQVGTYFVGTSSFPDYKDELYDDIPCPNGTCDVTLGTPIALNLGDRITGIDFELEGTSQFACLPSSTVLCLNEGRFSVEVDWRDIEDQTGDGFGIELTDDTGYFWFFSPDNVEMVIKVLDGCFDPFDTFWVFAGGLTDVEVALRVTDTATGDFRTYSNALGSAFEPIQDLAAFATCDAARSSEPASVVHTGRFESRVDDLDALLDAVFAGLATAELPTAEETSLPGAISDGDSPASCVPGFSTLCLTGGRFAVQAQWDTGSQSGEAQAIQLTEDTGYFWFFSPDNVEAVVKVLDACNLDPFNNIWVFAAGLTDVRVTLQVTDTATGDVREWINPQGTAFRPIREIGAFTTCP